MSNGTLDNTAQSDIMLVGSRENRLCSHTIVSGALNIIGTKTNMLAMIITPNGDLNFDDSSKVKPPFTMYNGLADENVRLYLKKVQIFSAQIVLQHKPNVVVLHYT